MYDLDFAGAQQRFSAYQHDNPDDPMGSVAEAAELLFSEFDRLGVLQSQMFVKDASFGVRSKLVPDPAVQAQFETAIQRSQAMVQKRLAANPNDRDTLLAAALSAGLKADYLALVQKQNVAALRYTRQATDYAQRLLAVCPNCYDAYVATGLAKLQRRINANGGQLTSANNRPFVGSGWRSIRNKRTCAMRRGPQGLPIVRVERGRRNARER